MVFASGRVDKFLKDPQGAVQGMLLDNGQEIRFSAAVGNRVTSIISEGSLAVIEGVPGSEDFPDDCFYAIRVTNLESRASATLPLPATLRYQIPAGTTPEVFSRSSARIPMRPHP
jgi:hypothetical protein